MSWRTAWQYLADFVGIGGDRERPSPRALPAIVKQPGVVERLLSLLIIPSSFADKDLRRLPFRPAPG